MFPVSISYSIRLIVAVPLDSISDVHLHRLLDNVFQSMVLLIGLEDLVAQRNTERIKRDLRVRNFDSLFVGPDSICEGLYIIITSSVI